MTMNSYELTWGVPVILYLFLAGVGAGALTASASMFLRGGPSERYFSIARYGAFLATPLVIIGTGMLVFELGSFQTGHWFKFLNLFKVINLSPMSIGTWLLTFFILIGIPYAYTFLPVNPVNAAPGDRFDRLRRLLAWICVPLGIGVAMYTGILLGAMPSRPFWNSPILALLFLVSALSTGVACLLLINTVMNRNNPDPGIKKNSEQANYLLAESDTLLIGLEILTIFLFIMYAHLSVGSQREAIKVIEWGGELSLMFWFWVVFIGLLIPVVVELFHTIPKIVGNKEVVLHPVMNLVVPVFVLFGGYMLRHVIVVAGQITGPLGL
jgi:formate-dependent nitrite reductase membrane component NrfD